jgi:hypothetical protein
MIMIGCACAPDRIAVTQGLFNGQFITSSSHGLLLPFSVGIKQEKKEVSISNEVWDKSDFHGLRLFFFDGDDQAVQNGAAGRLIAPNCPGISFRVDFLLAAVHPARSLHFAVRSIPTDGQWKR